MKPSEIREMTGEEMGAKKQELSEELMNLRFQMETGQLGNSARIRSIRKEVARINTIQSEKMKGIR